MSEATLEFNEPHPMAKYALEYVAENMTAMHVEALASTALEGNRTAEICLSTYNRLQSGNPVSDRYLMGLAWFVKQMRDRDGED